MPYNSETSEYERRSTTVIDATPDGDTVAVAIDTKLDLAADDAVVDLNHHMTNGRHYPATSSADNSRFLKQSPAGVVSWTNGIPFEDGVAETELAASTGSAKVGFSQGTTGAVARTAQDKLRDSVSLKDYGASGDGVSNDTTKIQNALSSGKPVYINPGEYKFSKIEIPANTRITGPGTFKYDGSLSELEYPISVGDGAQIESLVLRTPGSTEINSYSIHIGDGVEIGYLEIVADTQKPGVGVNTVGNNVKIRHIKTENIDRPIIIDATGLSTSSGSHIGFLDAVNYVRGIKYINHKNFVLGGYYVRGRSANTTTDTVEGHNGLLFSGASDGWIGDGVVEDAGEHAIRIGGNADGGVSGRLKFGAITAIRPRASAFKVNPLGGADLAENIEVASIRAVDCGEGSVAWFKNPDVVRIANARNVSIGWVSAETDQYSICGLTGLTLNDVNGFYCCGMHFDSLAGAFIDASPDKDDPDGDVRNVFIGSLSGTTSANSGISIIVTNPYKIGNIFINNIDVSGFATRFLVFDAGAMVDGLVVLSGRTTGSVSPIVLNPPSDARVILDIEHNGNKFYGRASAYRAGIGAVQYTLGQINLSDALPTGMLLNSSAITAAEGAYGGGIEFSRLGNSRRGAAIFPVQTGAQGYQLGIGFAIGNPGVNSSDLIALRMLLKHTGVLQLTNLPTYADNAAAVTGGLVAGDIYKTTTGEVRVRV